jgi:adenine phosphoribosyltransferase
MSSTEKIKSKIRSIPGFPKEGIIFRDITTLLQDAEGLQLVVKEFADRYKDKSIDVVAGIEARGFILGGVIAHSLGVGFVTIRKPNKLPWNTISQEYALEYGTDKLEIHTDAVKKGDKILLVDDLLATGGTAAAAAQLIEKLEAEVAEMAFIVNLPDIGGAKLLKDKGYNLHYLCDFEGD